MNTAAVTPTPRDPTPASVEAELVACIEQSKNHAPQDLTDLLGRFLTSIMALANAQGGAVRVLTDDGLAMKLVAHQGLPEAVVQTELLVDRHCGMCSKAASDRVLFWVDDLSACQQHSQHSYFGNPCQSMLAIALPYGSKILGVYNLFFFNRLPLHASTQSLLTLVGQLLGLTLHNAQIERERLRVTVLKERQDMVNEVHDVLAQTLAYARMRIPLLTDAIVASDKPQSLKYLADLKTAVTEVHDNLREVMTYFRTRMDPLGLLHALQTMAHDFHHKHAITLDIDNQVTQLNLSDAQEVQIFYIVQEALANIAKHSMARHAVVVIRAMPTYVEFLIEDDGLGMEEPSVATIVTSARPLVPSTHFGLDIMQSRAKRLGAQLQVGSKDGVGTQVLLQIPHPTPSKESL